MNSSSTNPQRADIRLLMGVENTDVRMNLMNGLRDQGYTKFRVAKDMEDIAGLMAVMVYDLILIDADLPGGDPFDLIKRTRVGETGANTYTIIMMVSWNQDADRVRAAINAGVDDFQVFPITPQKLLSRVAIFSQKRKPFIVTSDYVGPDRRKDPTRSSSINPIEVPNSLAMKESGQTVTQNQIREMVATSVSAVNDERIRRIGFQLSFLTSLILPAFEPDGEVTDEIVGHTHRLERMARDAVSMLEGSSFEAASELCGSMMQVTAAIAADPRNAPTKERRLLLPLSQAILKSFFPNDGEDVLAGQISSAIDTFKSRQPS